MRVLLHNSSRRGPQASAVPSAPTASPSSPPPRNRSSKGDASPRQLEYGTRKGKKAPQQRRCRCYFILSRPPPPRAHSCSPRLFAPQSFAASAKERQGWYAVLVLAMPAHAAASRSTLLRHDREQILEAENKA